MATSLSEFANGLGSKPLVEYAWWKHHVAFFGALCVGLPMVLTFYYGLTPIYGYFGISTVARMLANAILYLLFATIAITAIGSWFGYYFDAKYVATLDVEWSPHWVVYMAVHVVPIAGPLLAVPIYVMQRSRHVGLPVFSYFSEAGN